MPLLPNWICHPILQMTGVPEIVCPRVTIWGVSYARAVAPLSIHTTLYLDLQQKVILPYIPPGTSDHTGCPWDKLATPLRCQCMPYIVWCNTQGITDWKDIRMSDWKRLHLGFRCRYCGHIRRKDIRTDCQIGPTNFPVQIFWQLGRTNHISFIRAICHLQV